MQSEANGNALIYDNFSSMKTVVSTLTAATLVWNEKKNNKQKTQMENIHSV